MDDDIDLLADVDLSAFTQTQRDTIAQNLYKKLEDRVGDQVAAIVTDKQFDEFEAIVAQSSEEKLTQWLDRYVPTYEEITAGIFDQLKLELGADPSNFLQTD